MKKIIIDTNFWLIPFQLKVDIFSEIERLVHDKYELYIIDKTIDELDNIFRREKGKTKQAVKFALQLIAKINPQLLFAEENKNVDKAIISLAKAEDYIVATQDNLLKKQLKLLKRSTIVLRQKNHLELV